MTSAAATACLMLVLGATDEGRSADRMLALADIPRADARLGHEPVESLGAPLRGDEGIRPGVRREAMRMMPWLGPAIGTQLMMHESAHALVPFLRGDENVQVRFFPDLGAARFGEATWSRQGPAAYDALASAMPKLLDLAVITAAGRAKRSAHAPWSRGVLGALQLVALGDFLQGTLIIWRPPQRWNDAWYLTQRLEKSGVHLGKGGARAAMTALAAAGVALCAVMW